MVRLDSDLLETSSPIFHAAKQGVYFFLLTVVPDPYSKCMEMVEPYFLLVAKRASAVFCIQRQLAQSRKAPEELVDWDIDFTIPADNIWAPPLQREFKVG
ncbi:hypothetical protein ACEPAG_6613 [Sanghuangporus baumii]